MGKTNRENTMRHESNRRTIFVGNLELLSLRRPLRAGLLIIKKQGWKRCVRGLLEDSERRRKFPGNPNVRLATASAPLRKLRSTVVPPYGLYGGNPLCLLATRRGFLL